MDPRKQEMPIHIPTLNARHHQKYRIARGSTLILTVLAQIGYGAEQLFPLLDITGGWIQKTPGKDWPQHQTANIEAIINISSEAPSSNNWKLVVCS